MESEALVLLFSLFLWLAIFIKGIYRWRKEGSSFKTFQRGKLSWLTFILIGCLFSCSNQMGLGKMISHFTSDSVLQFILEILFLSLLTLSPQLLLLLLKKLN